MYKLINDQLCLKLGSEALASPRKRSHHNIHDELSDPVQRLCIGLHQGSYLRPHRHPENYKWEMMLVLSGTIRMLIFDDEGKLIDIIQLSEQGPTRGIEIPPGTWHTLYPVSQQAVIMEFKQGPYLPLAAENFASWAPQEESIEAEKFLHWCNNASIGDHYPSLP